MWWGGGGGGSEGVLYMPIYCLAWMCDPNGTPISDQRENGSLRLILASQYKVKMLTVPRRSLFCGSFLLSMFGFAMLRCPFLAAYDHLLGND